MDRPFHRQAQRRRGRSPAPLQDADGKRVAVGLKRDAQRCGRRGLRGLQRAKQRDPGAAGLGGDREAPQLLVACIGKPGEQRVAAGGAQHLLGGPQRIAPAGGAHHGELREIDARSRQRRRIGKVRRREPDDALARPGKRRHGRQHELQLADAFALAEDLAQRAGRPAAARELAVEGGKAARHRRSGAAKRAAAPHGMPLQDVFERRAHTVFLYSNGAGVASRRATATGRIYIVETAAPFNHNDFTTTKKFHTDDQVRSRASAGDGRIRCARAGLPHEGVAPQHGFLAGSFINSNRERSRYAGYHWRAWQWKPSGVNVSAGVVLALFDGYSNQNGGGWFPAMLPALSAEYGLYGANLTFIPNSKNGSAVALQIKMLVW